MKQWFFSCIFFLNALVLHAQQTGFTVHFGFDRDEPLAADTASFNRFINAAPRPDSVILYGHTDSKGNPAYNMDLSRRRAENVKRYLENKSFPKDLFTAFSLGETELLLPDDDNETNAAGNRRVSVVFVYVPKETTAPPAKAITKQEKIQRSVQQIIEDTATKKGTKINLRSLQFEGGRHIILASSKPELQVLLATMQNNPSLQISIEGHVCCIADAGDGYDFDSRKFDLSTQRARAVYDFLWKNGINKERLKYNGFGHSMPIFSYPERNSAEETTNRRVEITIISK